MLDILKAPPADELILQAILLKPYTVMPKQDLSQGVTQSRMYLTLGEGACGMINWINDHALRLFFTTLHC